MQTSKYLIANARDAEWGLTVSTVGYEDIAPGDDYPTHGHADGYYFTVERGRTLHEYQLLYQPEGEGLFHSASVKETRIKSGDMILLFPGEWHSYHPLARTGWKSHWIGFRGVNMDNRVKAGFLSPAHPIYHVGYSGEILHLYDEAIKVAQQEAPFMQQELAGIVNHLIGLMYALERKRQLGTTPEHLDMINLARQRIRDSLEDDLVIQNLAGDMGISYSNFRKLFKEYTGVSPAFYQQELRIQRAKELLATTSASIKTIAYRLRFDSPDYFSSKFKAKTGMKPSEFRAQNR